MTNLKVYNLVGKEVGEVSLNPKAFGVALNSDLVFQAIEAQESNSRIAIADTKTKAEVRGGGRKPWKQKGTGRARQGSIRAPQWKGGGVVFGPKSDRNFTKDLNKKMKKKALLMALSDKLASNQILIVDSLALNDAKTKSVVSALKNLKLTKSVLFAHAEANESLKRASANLKKVNISRADSLNIKDVVKYHTLVIEKSSLPVIDKTFVR